MVINKRYFTSSCTYTTHYRYTAFNWAKQPGTPNWLHEALSPMRSVSGESWRVRCRPNSGSGSRSARSRLSALADLPTSPSNRRPTRSWMNSWHPDRPRKVGGLNNENKENRIVIMFVYICISLAFLLGDQRRIIVTLGGLNKHEVNHQPMESFARLHGLSYICQWTNRDESNATLIFWIANAWHILFVKKVFPPLTQWT